MSALVFVLMLPCWILNFVRIDLFNQPFNESYIYHFTARKNKYHVEGKKCWSTSISLTLMVIPFLCTLFVVSHILQSMNRWLSRITSCTTFVILDIQKKNILKITYNNSCCSSKTWWLNSFLSSVKPNPNFMRNSNIVYP